MNRQKEETCGRDPPEQRQQNNLERAGLAGDEGGQVLGNTFGEIPQGERQTKNSSGVSLPGMWISGLEGREISLQWFDEGFCHWICSFQQEQQNYKWWPV